MFRVLLASVLCSVFSLSASAQGLIWSLPEDDADFSTRWRLIKTWFTKHCDPRLRVAQVTNGNRRTSGVWQPRYWEHAIRDETDFRHHMDYIHYNPVKHGHVTRPGDWV